MRRCVIIGGAGIGRYDVIKTYLRENDFMICCDSGLNHADKLGIRPDLIIGDFDSHEKPDLPAETITLPCEKDDTDTMAAIREAAARGFREFLLIGIIGGRLDHTLANIYILLWLDHRGLKAFAVDDYSELEIVSRSPAYVDDRYAYFSLVSISGKAEGVSIANAKYTLENAVIQNEFQIAVSNEPLPGKTAEITVKQGELLLIKDRL